MTDRRLRLLFLACSFVVLSLPVAAQRVTATLPVGARPYTLGINPATNRIYVANSCGNNPACPAPFAQGTVTVIDGATNNTLAVINVGYFPYGVAVNSSTNKIYVVNACGNDATCNSDGTVSVIDGASNTVLASPTIGSDPNVPVINATTNRIYVPNICGSDTTCATYNGTVSVIDGSSNAVIDTVAVGASPNAVVVNSVTNKIYVTNSCGGDPTCTAPYSQGTATVIDGATDHTQSVNVGIYPLGLDVNTATNKVYVANQCGNDPNCASTSSMTVIDGATLGTTNVAVGGSFAISLAVNAVTNKIYLAASCAGAPSCQGEPNGTVSVIDGATLAYTSVPAGVHPYFVAINSGTNKIYTSNYCGDGPICTGRQGTVTGTVTVIDGATLSYANLFVGSRPYDLALNPATNTIYVPNICGNDLACTTHSGTVSVIDGTPPTALQFVPLSQPCRAVDTRPAGRQRADSRWHVAELRHFRRRRLRGSAERGGLFH